jgi:dihydrofolate synthase/folylpolyglutamate synthase
MSDYERLVRRLYTTNLFNPVKLGLENMDRLHEMLGRPMDRPEIIVVHVAGSNGKGSVALKTAHALERYGEVKVGLFVSPHISSFRERIQIDGAPISESQVVVHLREIFDICDAGGIAATFFEVTTALAFRIFDEEGVDVVVLETGLGGRLDATNVIRRPALSVITSIGLEHTKILGDTIELIAIEKGGIMKRGCPALLGRNTPFDVLRRCAEERGVSRLFTCDDVLGPAVGPTLTSLEDYDVENSRIATAAIRLLQSHREKIESGGKRRVKLLSSEEIAKGVQIRPPCRFEELDVPVSIPADEGRSSQVTKVVRVILDVAHNPQAMDYLIVKLRANYPNVEKLRVVLGMSADKDLKYCTDILLNHVGHHPEKIHLVEASHPRAASISSIREANPQLVGCHYCIPKEDDLNLDGRDESSVSKQVRSALQLAAANDEIVVVCGTVFIMADAREELGIVEPRDSAVIAAVAGAGFRSSQENFGDGDTKKA